MKRQLCNDIETALGRQMQTPRDFNYLRDRIYARTHIMVSPTTLKRIWGYLTDDVEARESTLGILAQFLGYRDLEEYRNRSMQPDKQQSSPVMSRRMNVAEQLHAGDCLCIAWQPDRQCEVEYLGNQTFIVRKSANTRLQPNDTFQCGLIIDGEPLYLDNLCQGKYPPIAYVCGKKSGIRFEVLRHD